MEHCYFSVNICNNSIFSKSVELLINIFEDQIFVRLQIWRIATNDFTRSYKTHCFTVWVIMQYKYGCWQVCVKNCYYSIYCSLNWYQTWYILNHLLMCWVIDADILFIQRIAPNYSSYPVMDLHITRGVIISIKTCLSCNITRFEKKRHALTICT